MPKSSYRPGRNRRLRQPGMPGGAIIKLYQLQIVNVDLEEGIITIRAVIQPPGAETPIEISIWPIGVELNGLGITAVIDGEEKAIDVQISNPDEFTITAGEIAGLAKIFVPPALPAFTNPDGWTCLGLAETIRICPLEVNQWLVTITDFLDPENPVVGTAIVEGSLNNGEYEGISATFGVVQLAWASPPVGGAWQIFLPDVPPANSVKLIDANALPVRCTPQDFVYQELNTGRWLAYVAAVPP